jgi:hypothetical protein
MENQSPLSCRARLKNFMGKIALILFLFAAGIASAGETNYFCVVCGKGPLTGRIWLSKWGAICDNCAKLENRCSLCSLPIRDGDGSVKTGDGRFICKFDKTNAVLDADQAREVFEDARRDLLNLFGPDFALQYPDVTVRLFDVDYWSDKGRENGLHKFGFASTRKTPGGQCTHEVVLLSGRLRDEIAAAAAHEYTHLWINENLPPDRKPAVDTVEAICELAAYKLMESRSLPEQQRKILDNSYTHGEIKNLVEVEKQNGVNSVLNWVKSGTTETLDTTASFASAGSPASVFMYLPPPPLPEALKFGGLIVLGQKLQAVINGVAFSPGDTKRVKLRDKTVLVHCREVHRGEVVLEVNGRAGPVTLKMGGEGLKP